MPMASRHTLTASQEAFCQAMVTAPSATEAYRRAYNVESWASASISVAASRLLKNAKVQARIAELRDSVKEVVHLTAADVLKQLWHLAINAKRDADRIRALELCGRHLAMFTDKIRIEADDADLRRACEAAGLDPDTVLAEVDQILSEVKA